MQKYEIKDHAPSLLPDGKSFRLVWQDEFDGFELDRTKWDYRMSMMGKKHPAWTVFPPTNSTPSVCFGSRMAIHFTWMARKTVGSPNLFRTVPNLF